MKETYLKLSIIFPVKDSVEKLKNTLESVLSAEDLKQQNIEVIVCNDSNSPSINSLIKDWQNIGFPVFSESIPISRGSYNARNQGIQRAKGEFLIFFDVPIAIEVGWFQPFMELLKENDYVAGDIKVKPENCRSIAEKMYAATAFPVKSYFYEQHFGPTAFLGVRRDVFEKVGLFKLLYSGGDMEFGQRVHQAGFKMAFFDQFPAWHPARNLKQQFWKKVRAYAGIYAMHKNNPKERGSPIKIKSLISCLVAIPANWIKFRKNKIYRTGWFSYPEYVLAVAQFWGVEFMARLYVRFYKDKVLNT